MESKGLGEGLSDELTGELQREAALIAQIVTEFNRRIVGQRALAERLIMALIAEGHVLLEGVPGLAKTTAVRTIAEICHLQFQRIQFTPDLLPADVVGTQIFDPKLGDFKVRKGPVFTNLLLADEINRAPAKVQSALLEAMQERQVTIGDQSFPLPQPFLVMATQNPIEQEGTYPLPEAQVDRFLFKVLVTYPSVAEEQEMILRQAHGSSHPEPLQRLIGPKDLTRWQQLLRRIHVSDKIRQYIVHLVSATRRPAEHGLGDLQPMIEMGASPRATLALERAARVNALFKGWSYVVPQDVKDVGLDILRHRIALTFVAEADQISAATIAAKVFERVDVP